MTFKNQHEKNRAIESFIETLTENEPLTADQRSFIQSYTGSGGLADQGATGKGLLSEYYTPAIVVKLCWILVNKYTTSDNPLLGLEPSCGIGGFFKDVPNGLNYVMEGIEIDPVSCQIAKALFPRIKIGNGAFESLFMTGNKPTRYTGKRYDLVIGNPPYGIYQNRYKGLGEGKEFKKYEDYFVSRSLDILKDNGLLVMVLPTRFLDTDSKIKQQIIKNSCLVDAYRLPMRTFSKTDIMTDIVVLKKQKESNQDFFTFFTQKPSHILGKTVSKNRFGKPTKVVVSDKSNTIEMAIKRLEKSPINDQRSYYTSHPDMSDEQKTLWSYVQIDGSIKDVALNGYADDVNYQSGKLYLNFHYFQGHITEKLAQLEIDKNKMSMAQYTKQKEGLLNIMPQRKSLSEIQLVPASEFVKTIHFGGFFDGQYQEKERTLLNLFTDWLYDLSSSEREGLSSWDIERYIHGERVSGGSKEENKIVREKRKSVADKLFMQFINSELTDNERSTIESEFNNRYNQYAYPDYTNVPVTVEGLSETFKGARLKIKEAQIEGAAFLVNKGVGLLAFEVGVGKTMTGIIATIQNLQKGWCKRPLILVPKSVYENWGREIKELFPDIPLNRVGNMSGFEGSIDDGSITLATHEALEHIYYDESTQNKLVTDIFDQMALKSEEDSRNNALAVQKSEEIVGKAQSGDQTHYIDSLGFDHVTVDEAHRFKNLFGVAKSKSMDKVNEFRDLTGSMSNRAAKLFLLTQYILKNNHNRNVFLLTATPFNNSPLEIYNILSYMARYRLKNIGLHNINDFMETFVDARYDWVIKPNGTVEKKQVVKGFINAGILRELISEFILFKTADDANVCRPDKQINVVQLNIEESQKSLMASYEKMALANRTQGDVLKAIGKMRLLTLSPDIIQNNPKEVTPTSFVENSPKLFYTAQAIKQVITDDPTTSQLVYMPQGKEWIPLLRDYLVTRCDIDRKKVAEITSGTSDKRMNAIVDQFNSGQIQVLIGTSKISEGLNLNKNTSVLYNLYLGWNPTEQMQVEGRIWRQGNRYKKIRVVYPILRNSIDSVMFQKLEEKTARINFVWQSKTDYISTEVLNPEELKLGIISDPTRRADMAIKIKEESLTSQKHTCEIQKKNLESLLDKGKSIEQSIAYCIDYLVDTSTGVMSGFYKKSLKKHRKKQESFAEKLEKKGIIFSDIPILIDEMDHEMRDIESDIEGLKESRLEKIKRYQNELKMSDTQSYEVDYHIHKLACENELFFEKEKDVVKTTVPSVEFKKIQTPILKKDIFTHGNIVYVQPMLLAV